VLLEVVFFVVVVKTHKITQIIFRRKIHTLESFSSQRPKKENRTTHSARITLLLVTIFIRSQPLNAQPSFFFFFCCYFAMYIYADTHSLLTNIYAHTQTYTLPQHSYVYIYIYTQVKFGPLRLRNNTRHTKSKFGVGFSCFDSVMNSPPPQWVRERQRAYIIYIRHREKREEGKKRDNR